MSETVLDSRKFCCIHGANEQVYYLRSHDVIGALREIRSRASRDWGWSLPTVFNLDEDLGGVLFLVLGATLADTGIIID